MRTEMRLHLTPLMGLEHAVLDMKKGQEIISLSVPAGKAREVADAIKGMLSLAGHKVRRINLENEEVVSGDEVIPDASPAVLLRGLRDKEDITQAELATRLRISPNMVSDMERGTRPISLKMAKRIGEVFGVPYKMFL